MVKGNVHRLSAAAGDSTKTVDEGFAAHYEHTIVVRKGAPLVFTAGKSLFPHFFFIFRHFPALCF